MKDFSIEWPTDHADYMTDKGYILDVKVWVADKSITLTIYDPVRLEQDLESVKKYGPEFFSNLLVVEEVTVKAVEAAVAKLLDRDELEFSSDQ